MDGGQDPTRGHSDARQELVDLLITPYGDENVARCDADPLDILADIASDLQDLNVEVLEDSSHVDRGSHLHLGGRIVAWKSALELS